MLAKMSTFEVVINQKDTDSSHVQSYNLISIVKQKKKDFSFKKTLVVRKFVWILTLLTFLRTEV